jgi:hypothetical protein
MNFTVGDTIIRADPESICIEKKKIYYENGQCTAHDCFIDASDKAVYLVREHMSHKLVWVYENQLHHSIVAAFNQRLIPLLNFDCNTYKGYFE